MGFKVFSFETFRYKYFSYIFLRIQNKRKERIFLFFGLFSKCSKIQFYV